MFKNSHLNDNHKKKARMFLMIKIRIVVFQKARRGDCDQDGECRALWGASLKVLFLARECLMRLWDSEDMKIYCMGKEF